ncbi:MAG: hypothetical protein GF355_11555 [Candidatus Eisenbacteria bacterium]|nr:hypothetical protein [Candidatus Eisenbacteria bacterium]
MRHLSLRQIATLKKLAQTAHDREQVRHLDELSKEFESWRSGALDADELATEIDEAVQSDPVDISLRHKKLPPDIVVARALMDGLLRWKEIPGEVRLPIRERMKAFRETWEDRVGE